MIKKDTGNAALDYIQFKVIDEAKGRIFDATKSINDIASELVFKYQQHFTRLFKQKTGIHRTSIEIWISILFLMLTRRHPVISNLQITRNI